MGVGLWVFIIRIPRRGAFLVSREGHQPVLVFLQERPPMEKLEGGAAAFPNPRSRSSEGCAPGGEHAAWRMSWCAPDRDVMCLFGSLVSEKGRTLLGFALTFNIRENPDIQSQPYRDRAPLPPPPQSGWPSASVTVQFTCSLFIT